VLVRSLLVSFAVRRRVLARLLSKPELPRSRCQHGRRWVGSRCWSSRPRCGQCCPYLQDADYPTEARSLGCTLLRWRHQIAAWHLAHVSNGPTEAVNNLIKRVKRAAFGFTSFRNYRIRSLLYAGKPNWDLLATVTRR